MPWIKLTSVTATSGQKTVNVNSGNTAEIKPGDALKIGAFDIYEIEGVFASQVTLREVWGHATQTNAQAVVVPTFGDFNSAVEAMRNLTDVAVGNLTSLENWGTKLGNFEFKGKDNTTHTARTMQQMDADVAEAEQQAIEIAKAGVAEAINQLSGAKVHTIIDNFGNAQQVCRLPACTFEDLAIPGCPFTGPLDAFRRQDGSIRPYIDVAMHEMANVGGKSVSQAGLEPWTSIDTDYTRARCEELADNAVMAGRYVAALLGWLMISKGFQPRGNTEYGRSHSHTNEFGQRSDGRVPNDRAGAAKVLTGTGPNEWRHDGTVFGVSNWVGNVWERDEDWKLVDGQIYVAEYIGQPEANWLATGRYINTGHKFSMTQELTGASNYRWNLFTKSSDYVEHELLQRLLIEPIECTKVLDGQFYYNLEGEQFPLRNGGWSGGGPAALHCYYGRSYAHSSFGARFAFIS